MLLRQNPQRMGSDHLAKRDQVKGVRTTFDVDRYQAQQRQHRTSRQIDRHLHCRIAAVSTTPDANHDKGRDQGEFVEEVEVEDVDA